MEIKTFFRKNIETLCLTLILILFIWKAYPLSNTLTPLDSSDFSAHIFKINYISENGLTGWNSYWYGGFPFMKYYPPLSYLIVSSINYFSLYFSYSLMFDIVWLLIPISIFILIRTFKIAPIQKSIALLLISLSPATLVFFRNSNLPFITSFLFSVLFLAYLKKFTESKASVLKPIILLTSVLFTHVLMAGFLYISAIIWFFSYRPSKKNISRFLTVIIIPASIASVWYIPFSQGVYSGREGGLSILSDPITYTSFTANQRLTTMGIPKELFYIFGVFLSLSVLLSLKKFREKIFAEFFPWLIVSSILFILLDYKRISILMIIPIAILASLNNKKRIIDFIIIPTIIFNIIIFSLFTLNFGSATDYPKTGNRAIFYDEEKTCPGCSFYSAYMPQLNGDEIINGWLPQSQNTNELFQKRGIYFRGIQSPLNLTYKKFNELANAGMINYIAVSKNSEQFLDYFKKNPEFKFLKEENGFVIFDAINKSSFIEIDGAQIVSSVNKSGSKISADFKCARGVLTVKETYDRGWKIKLNSKEIASNANIYGFIEANIEKEGQCHLEMLYSGF